MMRELRGLHFLPVDSTAHLSDDEALALSFIIARHPVVSIGDVDVDLAEMLSISTLLPDGLPAVRRFIGQFRD